MSKQPSMTNIISFIKDQIANYKYTYQASPHFVKIPLWLYSELNSEAERLRETLDLIDDFPPSNFLLGLTPCPTVSITKLEEIEVF